MAGMIYSRTGPPNNPLGPITVTDETFDGNKSYNYGKFSITGYGIYLQ